MSRKFSLTLLSLMVSGQMLLAQIPQTMSYQGVLTDTNGNAVPDGNYNITFRLYDDVTTGNLLWSEALSVTVNKGIFNVILGTINPLNLAFDRAYWLGVTIGDGAELSPRIQLTASPYGLNARSIVDNAVTSAKIQDGQVQSADLANGAVTQDKLAVDVTLPPGGTAGGDLSGTYPNPTIATAAVSKAKLSATGGTSGQVLSTDGTNLVWQEGGMVTLPFTGNVATTADAFRVTNTGDGHALVGITGSTGYVGVLGEHAASGNSGSLGGSIGGVSGTSTSGHGVYGISSSGLGVRGESDSGWGVYGESNSNIGVRGSNSNSGNYGYLGSSDYGVYGSTSTGSSVYGRNGSTGNYGALGTTSHGAFGSSSSGFGVYGTSSSGNGVHGHSISGYAGYFAGRVKTEGDVDIAGTLSKGGGAFKIDHPLDPENKYLYHSFVESPDMMNIYNGNITLDRNGEAWVELPTWLEALNNNFRYQLTSIGAPAPNLHIAEKIIHDRFKIAGGLPGLEVSWQVTGIRHDPFAEAHRIPVEEEKSGGERGKYLYPKEYGMSETAGIDYDEVQRIEEQMKVAKERLQLEQEKMKAEDGQTKK